MKKPKPNVKKTVKEAERTVAANPRYEGLTIAGSHTPDSVGQKGGRSARTTEPEFHLKL